MLRDIIRSRTSETLGPSRRIVEFLNRFRLHPMIYFPVADVRVSLWVVLVCGLATGYLAGTIGVGGFIGVPAMIYVFGVSAQVAAGSELFLAMFMGAFGAINYALEGMVDLRMTMLLFVGSLVGIHIGAYGTKVVKEVVIRLATATIILLCVAGQQRLSLTGDPFHDAARDLRVSPDHDFQGVTGPDQVAVRQGHVRHLRRGRVR